MCVFPSCPTVIQLQCDRPPLSCPLTFSAHTTNPPSLIWQSAPNTVARCFVADLLCFCVLYELSGLFFFFFLAESDCGKSHTVSTCVDVDVSPSLLVRWLSFFFFFCSLSKWNQQIKRIKYSFRRGRADSIEIQCVLICHNRHVSVFGFTKHCAFSSSVCICQPGVCVCLSASCRLLCAAQQIIL